MKRILTCIVVWSILALGIAQAVPARPLYEPPDPPNPPPMLDLNETLWKGAEAADQYILFHADGTLSFFPQSRGGGSWKKEGNTVYFEINKGYREFRGSIQGDIIQGDSWNVAGKRWNTVLKRAPGPNPK
jgi:hypothetical protein